MLVSLLLLFVGIGTYLALGVAGILFTSMLGLIALSLTLRFWYVPAAVMFSLCLVIFLITGALPWFLGVILALVGIACFVPSEKVMPKKGTTFSFWLPSEYSVSLINLCSCVLFASFFRYIAEVQDWLIVILMSLLITILIDVILWYKRPSLFASH